MISGFEIGNALPNFDLMEEIKTIMTNMVNVCSETCLCNTIEGDVLYLRKIDFRTHSHVLQHRQKTSGLWYRIREALLMDHNTPVKKPDPNGLKKLTKIQPL